MFGSSINFVMISESLTMAIEILQRENQPSVFAMQNLKKAQEEFQQALSFSLTEKLYFIGK